MCEVYLSGVFVYCGMCGRSPPHNSRFGLAAFWALAKIPQSRNFSVNRINRKSIQFQNSFEKKKESIYCLFIIISLGCGSGRVVVDCVHVQNNCGGVVIIPNIHYNMYQVQY